MIALTPWTVIKKWKLQFAN